MEHAATARLFGTVELVELILSHLTVRDLLAAQRVNYLFQQVIKRNPRTQRSLYLLQDAPRGLAPSAYAITNPLYVQRFVQQACLFALRQLNPKVHFIGIDRFVEKRDKSFADPAANWRTMLLFQPAIRKAMLRSMSMRYEDGYHYIENKEGLRMGDVVTFFQKLGHDGLASVELLSATVTRKVVWSIMPMDELECEAEKLF